jgi:hypothetical protein
MNFEPELPDKLMSFHAEDLCKNIGSGRLNDQGSDNTQN